MQEQDEGICRQYGELRWNMQCGEKMQRQHHVDAAVATPTTQLDATEKNFACYRDIQQFEQPPIWRLCSAHFFAFAGVLAVKGGRNVLGGCQPDS